MLFFLHTYITFLHYFSKKKYLVAKWLQFVWLMTWFLRRGWQPTVHIGGVRLPILRGRARQHRPQHRSGQPGPWQPHLGRSPVILHLNRSGILSSIIVLKDCCLHLSILKAYHNINLLSLQQQQLVTNGGVEKCFVLFIRKEHWH